MNTSRPQRQLTAHIEASRVGQAHALLHQLLGGAALRNALQFGQLHLAVNAEHFPLVFRVGGADRQSLRDGHADDVGQVVLFLRIVVGQTGKPLTEASASAWP